MDLNVFPDKIFPGDLDVLKYGLKTLSSKVFRFFVSEINYNWSKTFLEKTYPLRNYSNQKIVLGLGCFSVTSSNHPLELTEMTST